MKIKLTGKFSGESDSSFKEFEIDRLPTIDEEREMNEERSCYEAIWFGSNKKHKNVAFENTMMLGLDYMEQCDLDILEGMFDADSFRVIKREYKSAQGGFY